MFTSQRRPMTYSSSEEKVDAMEHFGYEDMYDYNEDESEPSESTEDGPVFSTSSIKVVEPGTEHTGRWTRQEHEAFLSALRQYGKEWKKVAARVKTRTVVQTRTHAQKYFQKLQKGYGDASLDGDDDSPDLVNAHEVKKRSSSFHNEKEKSCSTTSDKSLQVIMPKRSSQTGDKREPSTNRSTVDARPSLDSTDLNQKSWANSKILSYDDASLFQSSRNVPSQYVNKQSFSMTQGHDINQIKIINPAPDFTFVRGRYPEPSPAACGKRKVMELAAAELLADVASSMVKNKGGHDSLHVMTINKREPFCNSYTKMPVPSALGVTLQIMNPERLDSEHGKSAIESSTHPSTPWESSLSELIRTVQCRESQTSAVSEEMKNLSSIHPLETATKHHSNFHLLVCNGSVERVRTLIQEDDNHIEGRLRDIILQIDSIGFTPLHSAVCLPSSESESNVALIMANLLLSAGADVFQADSFGNTALHWAARSGNREVIQLLAMQGCPLDAQNCMGETALHWAMRAGNFGEKGTTALLSVGARVSVYNNRFRRPLDVAAMKFTDVDEAMKRNLVQGDAPESDTSLTIKSIKSDRKSPSSPQEKKQTRLNYFQYSPQSRTLVLYHPECLEHTPKAEYDWESPKRVQSVIQMIESAVNDRSGSVDSIHEYEIQMSSEFERATLEILSRIHSAEYLAFVNDLSKELEQRNSCIGGKAIPLTPVIQHALMKDKPTKATSQSETSFSMGSLRAARRAVGAVQHAVDRVLIGRNRNAFCVIRPPGHHAGVNGLLSGSESCGFSIFNNVAAGAMHALSEERNGPKCDRCAIIDIDAHHGDGTEEIVRNCRDPQRLFFFSVHLYDNDNVKTNGHHSAYTFYPGTGNEDDYTRNIINVPITPLWKDDSVNYSLLDQSNVGREAYRQAITKRLLPALRAFNPDLILISIGFDACKGDVGNAKHSHNGDVQMGLNLEPEDYAWTTSKIMEVADICCQGRVISVLEGGYGIYLNQVPSKHRNGVNITDHLDRTIFSESALRHLSALIDPYNEDV